MIVTLEQRFDDLIAMVAFYKGAFPKKESLGQNLRVLQEIMTSSSPHALHPSMKEYMFETYNLCVDYKLACGATFAECIWAMTNQIKDLQEDMESVRNCGVETEEEDNEHQLFLELKRKEIIAILDVTAALAIRYERC